MLCSWQQCIKEYISEAPAACSTDPRNKIFLRDTVIGRIALPVALLSDRSYTMIGVRR